MDFRPIPPSGKVEDLRNVATQPTPEQQDAEKQAKREKTRRNLRIIALCLAVYYFGSAGYSWYEESQHEASAVTAVNMANPLKDPQVFRDTFNELINAADTSLPIATANDSSTGFVSVLSPALELQGHVKPQSKELQEIQIQTRYPDAFPPESIVAFRSFVLACERLADPNATPELADSLLTQVGLIPKVDANENDKQFPATIIRSNAYEYRSTFTGGPIDELTLIATPLANLNVPQNDVPSLGDTPAVPNNPDNVASSDVPNLAADSSLPAKSLQTETAQPDSLQPTAAQAGAAQAELADVPNL